MVSLLLGGAGTGSKMVQQVLNSAVLHTIWCIWIERNHRYFSNVQMSMTSLFNVILAEVHLSFTLAISKGASDMLDYKVFRLVNLPLKTKRISIAKTVTWCPPSAGIVKIKCDGSSFGQNPCGAVGYVIRDSFCNFLGAMASNIGQASSLDAEFCAFMLATEKAKDMSFPRLWMETDSVAVVTAFYKDSGIPWKMRSRWHNCMNYCRQIGCTCTHILREGNRAADALAKNGQGLSMFSSQWWTSTPPFISSFLSRDSLGLSFSRISMD